MFAQLFGAQPFAYRKKPVWKPDLAANDTELQAPTQVGVTRNRMALVPEALEKAFYAGHRSESVPFVINDSVVVVAWPHAGRYGW